jgi:hypothetical protein
MKPYIFTFFITVFLNACNNNPVQSKSANVSNGDSEGIAAYLKRHKNDTIAVNKTGLADGAEHGIQDDLSSIFNDYIATYKIPCLIDSTFRIGGKTYSVHLKHYCLMDRAISVPKSYIYMYKLDSFVTHNFVSAVRVLRDGHVLFKSDIHKPDFKKLLNPELRKYGVLLCPEMRIVNDTINLDYSISIPLTDVGIGVSALLDSTGKITYRN